MHAPPPTTTHHSTMKQISALPSSSKAMQIAMEYDIPPDVLLKHLRLVKEWHRDKFNKFKKDPSDSSLHKIFNDDLNNLESSKRYQINIDGRSKLYQSPFMTDYLLPYIKDWGRIHKMKIEKILLLISEDGCVQQIPHIDDDTGMDDFVVALFTLCDDTNFVMQSEHKDGKPMENRVLPANTLVFFHSSKVHAGGENHSGQLNFRYHFRFRSVDGVTGGSNADDIGIPQSCMHCNKSYVGNMKSLYNHQRFCLHYPEGAKRYAERTIYNRTKAYPKRKKKKEEEEEMKRSAL